MHKVSAYLVLATTQRNVKANVTFRENEEFSDILPCEIKRPLSSFCAVSQHQKVLH